jgi:DNA-binding LacI/PurR family transcriptional regulator
MPEDSAKRRDWSPGPFLAHLNLRHPDTVLFLARHFVGEEQLTDAHLAGIKGDQLVIGVTTTGGSRTVPLPLTSAVASRSELGDQMAAMLQAAREARPDEPLTSLEVDISAPHAAGGTIADTPAAPEP